MFLYNILGVEKKSSINDIKNAYRNLAKKYHPDLNDDEGSELIFKTIKIAYEILSNDYTRNKYDLAIIKIENINDIVFSPNFEKEVKNAYLQDLSLSMEFKRKIVSNLNYYIANTIVTFTINNGVAPNEIERIIKSTYSKYEQMVSKDSQAEPKQEKEVKNNLENDSINSENKNSMVWILFFVGILALTILIFISLNDPKRLEELERARIKQERLTEAQSNPDLYWNFTFTSPNKDNTFFSGYSNDYSGRSNKDMYCVVVGVTANKDIGSVYYLDDSYDNGSIFLYLDDFKIGSVSPTDSIMYSCDYISNMFPITTSWTFSMAKGETIYLLYEIYPRVISDTEPFKYKNNLITDLIFE